MIQLLLIVIVATLLPNNVSRGEVQHNKLMEFGRYNCEDEMSKLDYLAVNLQENPETYAYIVVYGGRLGMQRGEVEVRAARMRRYLVETRGITSARVVVRAGSFREKLTVEIWSVPRGANPPAVTPGLDRKKVKFKRGEFDGREEPGCFPDKLPVARSSPA